MTGSRGPVSSPASEQVGKGARPNRVKQATQSASVAFSGDRLGEAPGFLPERARRRWAFLREHFPHIRECDSMLVQMLVLAEHDLEDLDEDAKRTDRVALRKEIVGYLGRLGCWPTQRKGSEESEKVDPTKAAMEAFDDED